MNDTHQLLSDWFYYALADVGILGVLAIGFFLVWYFLSRAGENKNKR